MKVALYLGSFNPFHKGHLDVVLTALNNFKMDKVVIVPTMQNPWKKEEVLDIGKRCQIIFQSCFDIWDYYEISTIEKYLNPPYYSYATLHALKNKYCSDEIFVLCGSDTIEEIPDWMNGEQIIKDYDFLIVDRLKDDISSTLIREKIRNGKDISNYVSPNVIKLIEDGYKYKM